MSGLMFCTSSPLGPLTVTNWSLTVTLTPAGMLMGDFPILDMTYLLFNKRNTILLHQLWHSGLPYRSLHLWKLKEWPHPIRSIPAEHFCNRYIDANLGMTPGLNA